MQWMILTCPLLDMFLLLTNWQRNESADSETEITERLWRLELKMISKKLDEPANANLNAEWMGNQEGKHNVNVKIKKENTMSMHTGLDLNNKLISWAW